MRGIAYRHSKVAGGGERHQQGVRMESYQQERPGLDLE